MGRSGNPFRGGWRDRLPALGAGELVQPVLRDFQTGCGQVEDLARLLGVGDRAGQVFPAGAGRHRQIDHAVRSVRPEQRVSGMSRLSSGLLSRGGTQTFGRGLPVSVAGRRLVAVVTVLVQASFKDFDLLLQLLDLGKQGQDQVDDPFGGGSGQLQKGFSVQGSVIHESKVIPKILKVKRILLK